MMLVVIPMIVRLIIIVLVVVEKLQCFISFYITSYNITA